MDTDKMQLLEGADNQRGSLRQVSLVGKIGTPKGEREVLKHPEKACEGW